MIKEWELIDEEVSGDYKVFRIMAEHALSPRTGKVARFYTIDTNDWVNIIPLTKDNEVVMIRQYRHGSKEVTLEIPGGLVEDASPEEGALRELLEETGFAGDNVQYLGGVNPNPAIFNNVCHTFLVENAVKVAEKTLDPNEDIEVDLVPLNRIPQLITDGMISHALVIVAFHFLFLRDNL